MASDVMGFDMRLYMRTQFSHIDCYSAHSMLLAIARDLYDFHSPKFNPCPEPIGG